MYELDDFHPPLLWPKFIEEKYICRTLAYCQNDVLYLEPDHLGKVVGIPFPDDGLALVAALFTHNLLCFVSSLAPYYVAIRKYGGHICCNEDGLATSARIKATNGTTRWLVCSSQFEYAVPSLDMLTELRRLFDHAGVGTLNSFGSVGSAVMRRAWKGAFGTPKYTQDDDGTRTLVDAGWLAHRHQRPPSFACADFYAHSTGARSELLTTLQEFSSLIEIDEKNSYLDKLRELPTGRTVRFLWGKVKNFAAWVGHCVITIKEKLNYGIFPFRASPDEPTRYPTEPGSYSTWAGNRTIDLCLREGCDVAIHDGWGWYALSQEPGAIVELASLLRDSAPDRRTEDLFKICIVAGIGCLGMRPEYYELVEKKLDATDRPALTDDGFQSTQYIHKIQDTRPASMPHWMQYALEGCRLKLYEMARPFVEAEFAVATNTDAVYVRPEAQPMIDLMQIKKKSDRRETGDEGYRPIHPRPGHDTVVVPYPRGLISQEKTTLPGTTYEDYQKSLLPPGGKKRRARLVGRPLPDAGGDRPLAPGASLPERI